MIRFLVIREDGVKMDFPSISALCREVKGYIVNLPIPVNRGTFRSKLNSKNVSNAFAFIRNLEDRKAYFENKEFDVEILISEKPKKKDCIVLNVNLIRARVVMKISNYKSKVFAYNWREKCLEEMPYNV